MNQGYVTQILGGLATGAARVLAAISDLTDRGALALDKRRQRLEDEADSRALREALEEAETEGFIPWEQVKRENGLEP